MRLRSSLFPIALLCASAACSAQENDGPADSSGQEIEAQGPEGPLRGTLLSAASDNAPVALIIPGSGPTDRDGNSPMGIRAGTYRLLAQGLAENGISTVRADKRGMFGSEGAVADANVVVIDDYVEDVRSWSAAVRERTGVECIWLIGHSEGGVVALSAAQRPDIALCGLVLVAAPGRPLGDVLREQLRANPANAPLLDDAMAAIDQLEAGENVDVSGMHPALAQLFNPNVQGFLINLFRIDPAELVAETDIPVLIIQGERDIQVSVADAERLSSANPAAQLTLLPDTNHVLKTVEGNSQAANMQSYADPDLPLAPLVVETIATFVSENSGTE